jgi:hypothetical protein
MWNNHVHPKLINFFLRLGVTIRSIYKNVKSCVFNSKHNICMCSKWLVHIQMQYLCIALGHIISSSPCDLILYYMHWFGKQNSNNLVWTFNEIGIHVDSSNFELWLKTSLQFHTHFLLFTFQFLRKHIDLDLIFLGD